jgi:hypothetical protein
MHQWISINLRRGGQEESSLFVFRQPQRLMSAERAHLQRLNRQFQIVHRAGWGGKMPHIVHWTINEEKLGDILLNESEVPVSSQMGDVIRRPGHQIVDSNHPVTTCEQTIGKVRSQKPGGAGHQRSGLFLSHVQQKKRDGWRPKHAAI